MKHPFLLEASMHGARAKIIPISRLKDLKTDMREWLSRSELNHTQAKEIWESYNFDLPKLPFSVQSIVLVACPFPAYATVEFCWQGRKYHVQSIVAADLAGGDRFVRRFARVHGYNFETASGLPVKRLSVCSGLAVYGKNNITYVEGMGSFFYYLIYFSDMPAPDDTWREVKYADNCEHCKICFKSCETGAIERDHFLLKVERCLCFLNESPQPFPDWLPLSAHHLIYDCLKCQLPCPMNRPFIHNVTGPVSFAEQETELILAGTPLEELDAHLKEKVCYLGMQQWWEAIPRNLKLLLELSRPTG